MGVEPLPFNTVAGAFLLGFPALFSIINPIASALVFLNLTGGRSHAERVALAARVGTYGFLLLAGSIWLGGYLLNFFGVSLGALRLAGGLVVAVFAWQVLMAPDPAPASPEDAPASPADLAARAFFPLTMPLTTGPGSISVAIALASERPSAHHGVLAFFGGLILAALANGIVIFCFYSEADRVVRLVGETGAAVVKRLTAFLLLCIGVQIMANGAEALFGPWLIHTTHAAG